MIRTYKCTFGNLLPFDLSSRFGDRVELEAIEFINCAPIEWRIEPDPWRPGLREGRGIEGFHDLQRGRPTGGTMGLVVAGKALETRGIGDATVMVWLRDGTYSERKSSSETLPILQSKTADSEGEGCEVLA